MRAAAVVTPLEPTLRELMEDPLTSLLMASDGVEQAELHELLERIRIADEMPNKK